jgi:hypothetical protein
MRSFKFVEDLDEIADWEWFITVNFRPMQYVPRMTTSVKKIDNMVVNCVESTLLQSRIMIVYNATKEVFRYLDTDLRGKYLVVHCWGTRNSESGHIRSHKDGIVGIYDRRDGALNALFQQAYDPDKARTYFRTDEDGNLNGVPVIGLGIGTSEVYI